MTAKLDINEDVAARRADIRQSCHVYEQLTGKHVEFEYQGRRVRRATRVLVTWRNMGEGTVESQEFVQLDGKNAYLTELADVVAC